MDTSHVKKAELHCHTDELINPDFLNSFNKRYPDDAIPADVFENICPSASYDEWLNKYIPTAGLYIGNNGDRMLKTIIEHIERLKRQNVIYAELLLCGINMQFDNIDDQMELYRIFRESIDKVEEDKIQVELLIGLGRSTDIRRFETKTERVLLAKKLGLICGVALAGIESETAVKTLSDFFREFRKADMGIEIHAGEWCGPESVWDALEYGYPDRIGHGLSIFDDPVLVKHIKTHDIHIEFCPTSNLYLTGIDSIDKHPLGIAINEGMNFSINTDDPGPFCCTMESEFRLVANAFMLGKNDFDKILDNTMRSRFSRRSPRF